MSRFTESYALRISLYIFIYILETMKRQINPVSSPKNYTLLLCLVSPRPENLVEPWLFFSHERTAKRQPWFCTRIKRGFVFELCHHSYDDSKTTYSISPDTLRRDHRYELTSRSCTWWKHVFLIVSTKMFFALDIILESLYFHESWKTVKRQIFYFFTFKKILLRTFQRYPHTTKVTKYVCTRCFFS